MINREHKSEVIYPSPREAIAVLVVTLLLLFVVGLLFDAQHKRLASLFMSIITIAPTLVFLHLRKYSIALVLRLRPVSWRIAAISLVIGLALSLIDDELYRLMQLILPLPKSYEQLLEANWLTHSLPDMVTLVISLVIFAGIFQEMIFRGLLQNALEEKMDVTRAVLATAFIFSLVHVNPWRVVQIVFLGVILGVLAWKSDSIYPSAIVLATSNAAYLAQVNLSYDDELAIMNWHGHINPLLIVVAIAILYACIKLFYRFSEEDIEIPTFLNQPR